MKTFEAWLDAEHERRESLGIQRRLTEADRGTPLLDLAGNDYLGLSKHPLVIAGAQQAARRFGAGATASRLVSGTLSLHSRLESDLADFTGFESALVCSSGYHANLAVVTSLADADTLIVSDAHVHASLIDGCRLSRASVTVVPHNDVPAIAHALAHRRHRRAIVLAETVYSVLGDASPLAALAAVCDEYDALLVADDAHGLGVAGHGGRGLLAALDSKAGVVATATLSKSLGSQGGVVMSSAKVRHHLVNSARPFIYDTGLAPPAAGAASAALSILRREPHLASWVRGNAAILADACGVEPVAGAVLSVPVAGPEDAMEAVRAAERAGLRIGCFRPPSTPDGVSRVRLTAHAHHSAAQVAQAAHVLGMLLKPRGDVSSPPPAPPSPRAWRGRRTARDGAARPLATVD
jgi:8-amino-7-oxononanoate synthase